MADDTINRLLRQYYGDPVKPALDLAGVLRQPSTSDTLNRMPYGSMPLANVLAKYGVPLQSPRDTRPFPTLSDALMAPLNKLAEASPEAAFAANFVTPGVRAPMTNIRAWHGGPDFDRFDPNLVGTGAWADKFRSGPPKNPMFFMADNPDSVRYYGEPREFSVRSDKLATKNAAEDLEWWAKELGYDNPQHMIDKHFEGSIYGALDADNYFNDAYRDALKNGHQGVIVDFGPYVGTSTKPHISGKTIIIGDPSLAERVR